MMETVATQGREIKAVDRWTVSGRSLIIREMALVPLQLLEKETAAAPCLLERIHFAIGAEGLRSGVAKPERIFFFFSMAAPFRVIGEVQRGPALRRISSSVGRPSIRRSRLPRGSP